MTRQGWGSVMASIVMSRPTGYAGATKPHRQPSLLRRGLCVALHNGHISKFSAYPRGSCAYCGYISWWPKEEW